MKKLGYRKSRKGCLRCKQRRVKCDEKAPCSACIRHKEPCSLESPNAAPTEVPKRNNRRALTKERQPSPTCSPSEPGNDPPSPSSTAALFSCLTHVQCGLPDHSDNQAWLLDIELIHHYTAEGHRTLHAPCHHDRKVLQIDIPQEGLSHPFLVHQILAFSALHLAYLNPDCRHKYLIQASQHQGVAISTMNSILVKPWDPEACHALFMTSIFVAISAFGAFPSCERYNTFQPTDGLIDIFVLARGMHAILRSSEEDIRKGPLGKAMVGCDCKQETPLDCFAIITPQLNALLAHFEDQTFDLVEDKRKTLVKTVGALIEIAARNKRVMSVKEQRLIFGWPMEFPSTFLTLLRNRDPLAMVILSYYCVLLRSAETKCWYFEGWSSALMKVIITSIASTPFERLIQWPIETIDNMARISVKRKSTGVPNSI